MPVTSESSGRAIVSDCVSQRHQSQSRNSLPRKSKLPDSWFHQAISAASIAGPERGRSHLFQRLAPLGFGRPLLGAAACGKPPQLEVERPGAQVAALFAGRGTGPAEVQDALPGIPQHGELLHPAKPAALGLPLRNGPRRLPSPPDAGPWWAGRWDCRPRARPVPFAATPCARRRESGWCRSAPHSAAPRRSRSFPGRSRGRAGARRPESRRRPVPSRRSRPGRSRISSRILTCSGPNWRGCSPPTRKHSKVTGPDKNPMRIPSVNNNNGIAGRQAHRRNGVGSSLIRSDTGHRPRRSGV